MTGSIQMDRTLKLNLFEAAIVHTFSHKFNVRRNTEGQQVYEYIRANAFECVATLKSPVRFGGIFRFFKQTTKHDFDKLPLQMHTSLSLSVDLCIVPFAFFRVVCVRFF